MLHGTWRVIKVTCDASTLTHTHHAAALPHCELRHRLLTSGVDARHANLELLSQGWTIPSEGCNPLLVLTLVSKKL